MCIANIGLPRPSRGGYKNNAPIDASLFSKMMAKDDFIQMAMSNMPALEPTPLAEPPSTLTQEAPANSKPQHVQNHEQSAHIVVQHNYHDHANDEVIVMPQIETKDAIRNLDEILSVPGIEAVYVGPSDLSMALGLQPRRQGGHRFSGQ